MTEAQAAVGLDRLPWLPDEPPAPSGAGSAVPWLLGATALVVATAYWIGATAANRDVDPFGNSAAGGRSLTVPLPQPRPAESSPPSVEPLEPVAPPIASVEQSEPGAAVHRAPVEPVRGNSVHRIADRASPQDGVATSAARPDESRPAQTKTENVPQVWPVRRIVGASGRLVRIGAFATVHDAKRGWWAIVRANPALERLPALVVPVRSQPGGKTYYRLQMGTSSQAHSAVLCQRMRMVARSCVVIGLNKANGEVGL